MAQLFLTLGSEIKLKHAMHITHFHVCFHLNIS